MLPHFRRRSLPFGRRGGRVLLGAALSGALAVSGCDKLPLLAPSGTVITLIATSNVLAANGSIDIVATLIEQGATAAAGTSTAGQGTPVHDHCGLWCVEGGSGDVSLSDLREIADRSIRKEVAERFYRIR